MTIDISRVFKIIPADMSLVTIQNPYPTRVSKWDILSSRYSELLFSCGCISPRNWRVRSTSRWLVHYILSVGKWRKRREQKNASLARSWRTWTLDLDYSQVDQIIVTYFPCFQTRTKPIDRRDYRLFIYSEHFPKIMG